VLWQVSGCGPLCELGIPRVALERSAQSHPYGILQCSKCVVVSRWREERAHMEYVFVRTTAKKGNDMVGRGVPAVNHGTRTGQEQ
jgi:hypothetical protein